MHLRTHTICIAHMRTRFPSYTVISPPPMIYTLMRCMPMRCMPITYIPVRYNEGHAYEGHAHETPAYEASAYERLPKRGTSMTGTP
jgi:hypothetical protein